MKYIYKTAFDDKVISAAIINMAVKGFIDINEYDGKFTLMKKDNPKSELSRDDKVLYEELFKFSLLYLSYNFMAGQDLSCSFHLFIFLAEVAKMLNRQLQNILIYLLHRFTNATAEGINSNIHQIK